MFEKALSFFLNHFLAKFIESECWDENVQLALWSGFLMLENLELKADVFDYLKVPLKLSYGTIGKLEIRIPWSNLGNEPAVVVIDRVFLLVEPKYEWDSQAHMKRAQAIKQAKLTAAELFASRRLIGDSKQGFRDTAKSWLIESILHRVVNHVQG